MEISNKISIEEYNYPLTDGRIAKYPLANRDWSKLLIYSKGKIDERKFSNLPEILPAPSLLFYNNTRVIHARLQFKKITGARIEIFCLVPYLPAEYQLIFSQTGTCVWECLVGNAKKWKTEILVLQFTCAGEVVVLKAEKIGEQHEKQLIRFSWNTTLSFGKILDELGQIPIPPYLNRESEEIDQQRYQTIYSKSEGSVAAPTAGLHFTPEVFSALQARNISISEITLHVGAGTFQPVKTENVLDHSMHAEKFTLPIATIRQLANTKIPVIATGTTTLRTLESLYWLAVKSMHENKLVTSLEQFEYVNLPENISILDALNLYANALESNGNTELWAETAIMIVPGYKFRMVNALITNFHQPESTLLLLIAAFIGEDWKKVYQYALDHEFRFLSYGDSSLLFCE